MKKFDTLVESILEAHGKEDLEDDLYAVLSTQVEDPDHIEDMMNKIDYSNPKKAVDKLVDMHSYSKDDEKALLKLIQQLAKLQESTINESQQVEQDDAYIAVDAAQMFSTGAESALNQTWNDGEDLLRYILSDYVTNAKDKKEYLGLQDIKDFMWKYKVNPKDLLKKF